MAKIISLAEAMAAHSAKQLKKAQELGMCCSGCGATIEMFCCGETFPTMLSVEDSLRVQMDYGKLWTNGDAERLSPKMNKVLQELLNLMFEEKIIEVHLHSDGYVQCDR